MKEKSLNCITEDGGDMKNIFCSYVDRDLVVIAL